MAELLHKNLARHGLAFSVLSINGAIDEPKMRAMHKDQLHAVLPPRRICVAFPLERTLETCVDLFGSEFCGTETTCCACERNHADQAQRARVDWLLWTTL